MYSSITSDAHLSPLQIENRINAAELARARFEANGYIVDEVVILPSVRRVSCGHDLRRSLLVEKIIQCSRLADQSSPEYGLWSSQLLCYLIDIEDFMLTNQRFIEPAMYVHIVSMFTVNVFNSYPPSRNIPKLSWAHLHLVYECFKMLLDLPDFQPLRAGIYIDSIFLKSFVKCFDTNRDRERELLQITLSKIFSKFTNLQVTIINEVSSYILDNLCYENKVTGTIEMIEFVKYAFKMHMNPTLKVVYQTFMLKVLLPLHKISWDTFYTVFASLKKCLLSYLKRDNSITPEVVRYIIRVWPKTSANMEVLFLLLFDGIFRCVKQFDLESTEVLLFKKLAACMGSLQYRVALQALEIMRSEFIVSRIAINSGTILPIIIPTLLEKTSTHWNPKVAYSSFRVFKIIAQRRESHAIIRQNINPSMKNYGIFENILKLIGRSTEDLIQMLADLNLPH